MKNLSAAALIILIILCWHGASPGADFNGDSRSDIAVFRPSSGLWAVRGYTRVYFGSSGDDIVPGDYDGDGLDDIAVFRGSSGLWAVRGITRDYFGSSGDEPVPAGDGEKTYDYVVKRGNAADLVDALESTAYRSVFIPVGTYNVGEDINVSSSGPELITGEADFASIDFTSTQSLIIGKSNCTVEGLRIRYGGSVLSLKGNVYISGNNVTLRNCRSIDSHEDGFDFTGSHTSFVNCLARNANRTGFKGIYGSRKSRFLNCEAQACGEDGFSGCYNLTNCYAIGLNTTECGFRSCVNLSACNAANCTEAGFDHCYGVTGSQADGHSNTPVGFSFCQRIASCNARRCTFADYSSCSHRCTESTD